MKYDDSNYMKRNHYNQNWFNYKGCIDMQQPEFKQTFCILKLTGHTFVITGEQYTCGFLGIKWICI